MEDILTLPEAADLLRTPQGTLRYWRHAGQGPRSFKIGRRVMYLRSDIEAWVDLQIHGGADGEAAAR